MDFSMEAAIEQLNALRLHGHHHTHQHSSAIAAGSHTTSSSHLTLMKYPGYHHYPVSQEEESEEEENQQQQHRPEEDALRILQEQYETKLQGQQQQIHQTQEQMYLLQERYKASEEQNGFLKQALGQMETYYKTIQDQEIVIEELKKQVQQLKMANYRLQLMTQQGHGGHGGFMPPSHPDVY